MGGLSSSNWQQLERQPKLAAVWPSASAHGVTTRQDANAGIFNKVVLYYHYL